MAITADDVIRENYKQIIQCFRVEADDNSEQTKYCCRIDGCDQKYKSKSASIRHVRIHHTEIFKAIQSHKNINESSDESSFNEFLEIRVKVKREDIWNACVDLIAINGLPLAIVEFPAFKKILEPYIISLKRHGADLVINRQNIKKSIEERAQSIKESIALETKNEMVAVMLDIASRYNRAVLGISIAYFYDSRIQIKTIGMHTLHSSHTAANIKCILLKNLLDFNIRLEQILSVTTDNGKNLLKAIADINAELEGRETVGDESDSEDFIDKTIFDDSYYDDLLSEVRSMFNEINHSSLIHGISCGAHCLHLVITHALHDSPNTMRLIEKCRKLAKKLRTPSLRALLKSSGCSMAQIDVCTRWNSIYSMVILWILSFYLNKNSSGLTF